MKAIFERKPSDFDLRSFEVSKTIQLPADVFEAVLQKPMRDYDFIHRNIEQMHCDSSGVYHCLLLTGEGRNDGLLVESEGYGKPALSIILTAWIPCWICSMSMRK